MLSFSAIVRSAAISVKNKSYTLYSAGNGEELAVAQVAALFAMSRAQGEPIGIDRMGDDGVIIYHRLYPDGDGTASLCEVFYRDAYGLRYAARREWGITHSELRQERWLIRLNLFRLLCEITGSNPNPWGILSGVRPGKVVHRMLDANIVPNAIVDSLTTDFALRPDKARLVTEVALWQRPFLLNTEQTRSRVSIYIGIPFCPTRCLYCSFPAYVLPCDEEVDRFLQTLFAEMVAAHESLERLGLSVDTVYVGGGTPTSLPASSFDALLNRTVELFAAGAKEFTVEAGRPDSLSDEKINALARYGVTRVSVNPQTMQQKTLKLIGRMHSIQDIINVFGKIRLVNIPVVNMDIIAGLPGETLDDMSDTLRQICDLSPDNLTVHTLALKRGSRLSETVDRYSAPDADMTAKMLGNAAEAAEELGMKPYYLYRQKKMAGNLENVGYSIPGKECVYNIQVIEERQTIIGIGPAATTKVLRPGGLTNFFHPKDILTYIKTLDDRISRRDRLLDAAWDK